MDQKPDISIIVPIYKAERYLVDCLDSILIQTFKNIEIILVDDGSPDKSGIICDDYSLRDYRIKVIHKNNGGASTARRAGIEASKGKYIGWVDADDQIAPDMFEVLYMLAVNYQADIAECQYYKIIGNEWIRSGEIEPVVSGDGDFILKEFSSARMKPSFCNKLYRREVFDHISFPGRQIHVDFYVNMALSLLPLRYVRTSEVKYYYYVRENSNFTTYNARAIREAIYKYDHTMKLALNTSSELAKKFLKKDAINRLMSRYLEISVGSNLKAQKVYNYYMRRKLKHQILFYILFTNLPFKTRLSHFLVISDLNNIQAYLHRKFGTR